MKLTLTLVLGLVVIALSPPAMAADEPAAEPSRATQQDGTGNACFTTAVGTAGDGPTAAGKPLELFPQDPIQQTCSLQIECADGSVISCTGNTTCSTSSDGRCTICDGVQTACCPKTCCEQCEENYETCQQCDFCRFCDRAYAICVSNCTGGCS